MASFFLELKSTCKSYKFLILILILFLFQLVFIQQALHESKGAESQRIADLKAGISANESIVDMVETWWRVGAISASCEEYEKSLEYFHYRVLLARRIYESYMSRDWVEYHRSRAEDRLLSWDHLYQNVSPSPQQFFGGDWEKITEELDYPSFSVHSAVTGPFPPDEVLTYMTSARYSLAMAKTDLLPTGAHDTSPWAFTFNFLRRGLPNILGIVVLLLSVNMLHRDKSSGVIKVSLSAPLSRTRYLLRKLSLSFFASSSVIVLPQILSILILGIRQGFQGLRYPVLLDKNVLSSFTVFKDMVINIWFRDAGLSKIPVLADVSRLELYEFIPLWQFFGLAAVQILLFILFCTALGLLISILVKNEVIAHIVAAGIFVLGTSLGKIAPVLSTTAWDLFSKADVVPLLEGSHASTYLSSLLTLSIATILLFIVGAVIFKKQDIACN